MSDYQDHADAKATSIDEVGISSSPDSLSNDRPDVSGADISTVDDPPAKGTDTGDHGAAGSDDQGDKKAAAEDAAKGGEDASKTGDKGQDGRFDQHPDWQRMKQERDEAVLKAAKFEGMVEAITKPKGGEAAAGATPQDDLLTPLIPYRDITKMSNEELLEWYESDPKGYEANRFAQFFHEAEIIRSRQIQESQKNSSIQGTFDEYEKGNPDFKTLWDSGEIKKYMDAHPGHNAISAHMMLTRDAAAQSLDAQIRDAVDKAVKETTEKITADFKAKRNSAVIGDEPGTANSGAGRNTELNDTKSQGGLVSALAGRLVNMRRSAAGG